MCGICGLYNFGSTETVDRQVIGGMTDTLAHRGPDGEGLYIDNNLAMGHRRLSIIDLQTGQQPLANEDKSVWVAFNGEIYNYIELLHYLEGRGHTFKTRSDTEVLVHLYEEKKEEMLHDLRGMFSFSIWDAKEKRLFIARDRVGKKPLYYYFKQGYQLVYGSEIKAILASGSYEKAVNYTALDHYLSYQYVPTPHTIFQGIKKLPAGHFLVLENGELQIHQYWDLEYPDNNDSKQRSEEDCIEEFKETLTEAVKIRLRSDVPLGAFLSGGIDSSAIVSTMSNIYPGKVETLSIGFEEAEYNELEYAKQIADIFDCQYNEFIVRDDSFSVVSDLLGYFDEPFADPSFIPTYFVSRAAREKVTVALSGDGGDETLAGYGRHRIEVLEHKLRKLSQYMPKSVLKWLYSFLPYGFKGRNILGNLSCSLPEAAARKHFNLLFSQDLKEFIYKDPSIIEDCAKWMREIYENSTAQNGLDRMLYLDIKSYLHDDILVKVDRMSMAVGLEVRAPLLDHKVLELLATFPTTLKLHKGTSKYLLKKVLEDKVPQSILNRKKQGFRLPIEVWLKGPLKSTVEDIFNDTTFKSRNIYNMQSVNAMWNDLKDSRKDYAHQIWQILILELWFRKYMD